MYRLPLLNNCIDRFGDAAVFYTLEASCGYWQIIIREEDRKKLPHNPKWHVSLQTRDVRMLERSGDLSVHSGSYDKMGRIEEPPNLLL